MAEGIRIRHAVLKACVAIVKVPDYGPHKVTKSLWLRLDLNGEVIITDPVWQLLQQHTPGEWELLNTVLDPPTQHVSETGGRSPAEMAEDHTRLVQQAHLLAEWRARDEAIRRAVIELAPAGAASAHVTQGGIDTTRDRQRLTLSR